MPPILPRMEKPATKDGLLVSFDASRPRIGRENARRDRRASFLRWWLRCWRFSGVVVSRVYIRNNLSCRLTAARVFDDTCRTNDSVTGSAMSDESLQSGVWVRTDSGGIGRIILISRLSAFVDIQQDKSSYTATYLVSELTKIDEPLRDDV